MSRSDVASIFWFRLLLARVLFSPAYRSRGWWHMYTHTNHTRALTFDLEFERNTLWNLGDPRDSFLDEGGGFSCSFFLSPPRSLSLFLPLTRVSSCRGQEIFVFLFFYERGSLRTLSPKEPWSRTKDLTCVWFIRPSYLENYLAWIVIKW